MWHDGTNPAKTSSAPFAWDWPWMTGCLLAIRSRTGCPPGSTGNHATARLRPRTRRSCRLGGWLPHRRRTARYATAVYAGETPALPGGRLFRSDLGTAWPLSSNPTPAAIAPGFCFGRVHAVPAGGVGGCTIAGVLRGTLRLCMRAGRPRLSMGIENCRVLGTESGRVDLLSRGGSVATEAGRPTRERGRLARIRCGTMEPTQQRQARRPLHGIGRG